jgi:hypothetical protein
MSISVKFSLSKPQNWSLVLEKLDGGVNYSVPPESIADNELSGALNFVYDPNTYRLMHRPGVSRYSGTVLPGSGTQLHVKGTFYSSILDKELVVANSTLYYLDGSKNPQSIGALTGSGYPVFLDFNSKCLVASGGVLQSTDGTTISSVSNAPILSKIFHKDGRVFGIGDTSNPHRLWGSGPGDETDWDSVAGNAIYVDIENKVGEKIINAEVYKDAIIVFKGIQQRGVFAVVVPDGQYYAWYVKVLSTVSSVLNNRCCLQEENDLFFLDTTGFRSLVGVTQFGDIEQDPIGYKINSTILPTIDADYAFMVKNPYYNFTMIKYADVQTCYAYNHLKKAFLPIQFTSLKPHSACYKEGDKVFLIGMDDGFVYKMETSVYTDNAVAVTSLIKTKKFTGKGGSRYYEILKQVVFDYEGLASGTATLSAIIDGGSKTISLASITLETGQQLLFEANGYLNDASDLLYTESFNSSISRKFVNHFDIIFLVSNDTGAIKINRLESVFQTIRRR